MLDEQMYLEIFCRLTVLLTSEDNEVVGKGK